MPYFGYSKQNRKASARVPISASDVSRLLEWIGLDRLITLDLHCAQIKGFFSPKIPIENLETAVLAVNYFEHHPEILANRDKIAIISPDANGVYRSRKFLERMRYEGFKKISLAMIIKRKDLITQNINY